MGWQSSTCFPRHGAGKRQWRGEKIPTAKVLQMTWKTRLVWVFLGFFSLWRRGMAAANKWWRKLPGVNYLSCLLLRCNQTELVSRHPLKSKETNSNNDWEMKISPKYPPKYPQNIPECSADSTGTWHSCSKVLQMFHPTGIPVWNSPATEFCLFGKQEEIQVGLFSFPLVPKVALWWISFPADIGALSISQGIWE